MSRATREQLQGLHTMVVKELWRRVRKGTPSAEELRVARALLADNGITAEDDEDRSRLRRLWRAQLEALIAAVECENPNAATLIEVGRFLKDNDVSKDYGAAVDHQVARAALKGLAVLPFPIKKEG